MPKKKPIAQPLDFTSGVPEFVMPRPEADPRQRTPRRYGDIELTVPQAPETPTGPAPPRRPRREAMPPKPPKMGDTESYSYDFRRRK